MMSSIGFVTFSLLGLVFSLITLQFDLFNIDKTKYESSHLF